VALTVGRSIGAIGEERVQPRLLGVLFALAASGILVFILVTHFVDFSFLDGHEIPMWPSAIAAVVVVAAAVLIVRRGISLSGVVAAVSLGTLAIMIEFMTIAGPFLTTGYNTTGISKQIVGLQQQGVPYIHSGRYIGQFSFTGRFREPVPFAETDEDLIAWCEAHPDGFVIDYWRGRENPFGDDTVFMTPYRNTRTVAVVRSEGILRVTNEAQAEPH